MIKKTLKINNKLGLHARAASLFVKTAGAFVSKVTVVNPEKSADGKSIMSMMLLQAAYGTEIEICACGADEAEAMKAMEQIVIDRFGEPE